MKGNLQTRIARLERTLPPAKDDKFLGHVDEHGVVIDQPAKEDDWPERAMKAAERIRATMSIEHYQHVLEETYGTAKDLTDVSNLTMQFWLMAARIVHDETRKRASWESQKKPAFGLPPAVAQIYLDHPEATAIDRCCWCNYLVPVLLNSDLSGSHFHLHAHRFFVYCPLCSGPTGYYSTPSHFRLEIDRIKALRLDKSK